MGTTAAAALTAVPFLPGVAQAAAPAATAAPGYRWRNAVDPAHPDRVYLSLGTHAQSWAGNGAVPRSDDRGATWSRTDLAVQLGADEDGRGMGERLHVDPRDSDTLWLGTRHDGPLKSEAAP